MTATPAESREELEKLERKHAENPEGRYFVPLANAYRKAGEIDRAMTLLRQGLERHPDYLSAHIVLGRCLADRGETASADAEFRHVLSLDPQNLIALRTLGELAMSSGKVEEARSWYGDLLAVDPMNEDARRALDSIARVPPPLDFAAGDPEPEPQGKAPLGADEMPATERQDGVADHDFGEFFGTMVDLDSSAEGEVTFPEDADAVVTETIAELYTRQGFYDRAADVYRELIRRRGGDARLEERLRGVESLASAESEAEGGAAVGGAGPDTGIPSASGRPSDELASPDAAPAVGDARPRDEAGWISLPADETTHIDGFESVGDISSSLASELRGERSDHEVAPDDAFADSFTEGFSFQEGVGGRSGGRVDSVADMWNGDATSTETGQGPTIRDFMRSVVGWAPSERSAAAADEGATTHDERSDADDGFLADTAFLDDPSYMAGPGYDEALGGQAPSGIDWGEEVREVEIEEQSTSRPGADDIELLPSPEPADPDDLFPWEIPDTDADPLASDVPALESLQLDNGYPFDDTSLETGSTERDDSRSDGDLPFKGPVIDLSSVEEPPSLPPVEPEQSAAEPEPEPKVRPPTPDPNDDDDLESFQAWLRSLKH